MAWGASPARGELTLNHIPLAPSRILGRPPYTSQPLDFTNTAPRLMDAILARLDALERRNTALSQENEAILARSSAQARHIARLERQLDALETDMGRVEGGWEESWVEDEGSSLAGVETEDGKSWRWRKPKVSFVRRLQSHPPLARPLAQRRDVPLRADPSISYASSVVVSRAEATV